MCVLTRNPCYIKTLTVSKVHKRIFHNECDQSNKNVDGEFQMKLHNCLKGKDFKEGFLIFV